MTTQEKSNSGLSTSQNNLVDKYESTFISEWKTIFKIGGIATWIIIALVPIQMFFFIAFPPPKTVEGFFALFQNSWFLGLASLDLFYLLSNILLIPMYLALFFALYKTNKSLMTIAVIIGFIGISAFFASNTSFEFITLSNQYYAAISDAEKSIFLSAGQTMLSTYKGTAFDIYYVLNGLTLLILSLVMLKCDTFSKKTAYIGIVTGILMIIPTTAGIIGLTLGIASLIPWVVFSFLVAKIFFKLSSE